MKFAFYQGGIPCDVEANIKTLENCSRDAANAGVSFIAFSELFLCGYGIGDKLTELAEDKKGPSFLRISSIAKQYRITIAYGYAEKHGKSSAVYNSVAVVDKEGELILNYRKIHLYFLHSKKYAPIVTIEGIKVGFLICWDIEFPEPARVLALHGAQFVVVPTANGSTFVPEITVRSRASENHLFVAYINRVGKEGPNLNFCGTSICVGPNGDVLAKGSADKSEMYIVDIDTTAIAYATHLKDNPFFDDRVPHLYEMITAPLKNNSSK